MCLCKFCSFSFYWSYTIIRVYTIAVAQWSVILYSFWFSSFHHYFVLYQYSSMNNFLSVCVKRVYPYSLTQCNSMFCCISFSMHLRNLFYQSYLFWPSDFFWLNVFVKPRSHYTLQQCCSSSDLKWAYCEFIMYIMHTFILINVYKSYI